MLCKGKARQNITDLDLLMDRAGAINESFNDLLSRIFFNSFSLNHTTGLEFIAGPVKQPMRLTGPFRSSILCLWLG
jgi:hypothetical protein